METGHFKVERLEERCKEHDRQLIKCPVKNCTGCLFLNICKDNKLCSSCTTNVLNAVSAGSQRIWTENFKPIAEKYYKIRRQINVLNNIMSKEDKPELENKINDLNERLEGLGIEKEKVKVRII